MLRLFRVYLAPRFEHRASFTHDTKVKVTCDPHARAPGRPVPSDERSRHAITRCQHTARVACRTAAIQKAPKHYNITHVLPLQYLRRGPDAVGVGSLSMACTARACDWRSDSN